MRASLITGFVIAVLAAPSHAAPKAGDGLKKLPEAFRAALEKAEFLELMSVHFDQAQGKVDDAVGGYAVRKKTKLKGDTREITLILLDEGLAEGTVLGKEFSPKHAIRVVHDKKTYEVLISYDATQVKLFEDGKQVGEPLPISKGPDDTFTRTIRNALK
jgi:hypothetical protein